MELADAIIDHFKNNSELKDCVPNKEAAQETFPPGKGAVT